MEFKPIVDACCDHEPENDIDPPLILGVYKGVQVGPDYVACRIFTDRSALFRSDGAVVLWRDPANPSHLDTVHWNATGKIVAWRFETKRLMLVYPSSIVHVDLLLQIAPRVVNWRRQSVVTIARFIGPDRVVVVSKHRGQHRAYLCDLELNDKRFVKIGDELTPYRLCPRGCVACRDDALDSDVVISSLAVRWSESSHRAFPELFKRSAREAALCMRRVGALPEITRTIVENLAGGV